MKGQPRLTNDMYANQQTASASRGMRPKVKAVDANQFNLDLFARESYRTLKKGGHLYCFCDHYTFPEIQRKLVEARFRYKNCLVWVKNNHGSGDLRGNWAPQREFILFATKGPGRALKGRRRSNVLLKRQSNGKMVFFSKVSNYKYNHGPICYTLESI